jgi:hypothetical protein
LRWTNVQGEAGLGATLAIEGEITATGYPHGSAVLLSAKVSAQDLRNGPIARFGWTSPVPLTVAYPRQQWGEPGARLEDEFVLSVTCPLQFESSALEAFEELRQGGDFTLQIESSILMVDRGLRATGEVAQPQDVSPVLLHVDYLTVSRDMWGKVLQAWGRGVGIPLIVPLVATTPDAPQAEIVGHLRDAWAKADGADYSGSMTSSRKALELLRNLSPVDRPLPHSIKERTVDQRIHAVVDALHSLASASLHTDEPVKGFVPRRADAVGLAAATAALAQQMFARLRSV